MIFWLIEFLSSEYGKKIPAVFSYYSARMILALLTSFIFTLFLGPIFIRYLSKKKIGQPIRKEDAPLLGQLHEKKQNTPTMGGVLILASMLFSMVFWMDLKHIFTLILFITTVSFGALGIYDDYLKLKYKKNTKGLSAKKKFFIQAILSFLLASYFLIPELQNLVQIGGFYSPPIVKEGTSTVLSLKDYITRLYFPFFKEPLFHFSTWGIALFIFLVVSGSSNGVNLTDGLDGLASGCLVMVAMCLALFAFLSNHVQIASYLHILYIEGSGEIAIYLSAFAGACLGFLWYNGHPAEIFMGDTGSLSLGAILGVSSVLLKKEFLLALIGGVFVAEALSVILQVASYKLRKKRIFLCAPLHHHFEYKKIAETKVVIRFWIVSLLLAIIGIASLKFQ